MDKSDIFQGWSWPPNPKLQPEPASKALQQRAVDAQETEAAPISTYQRRLHSIHQTISSSLQSRSPLADASQILSADSLPLYNAAGTILQNASESPNPVTALSKYCLAEAIECCLPSTHDLTSYLAAQNPFTSEINERSVFEGKIRFIEFVFSEAEKQGTQEMITLVTYVQRLRSRYSHLMASNLYGDGDEDEDDTEDDADYEPSPERQPQPVNIDYSDSSKAITQLISLTEDSCAEVLSRPSDSYTLGIEKEDLAGAMEHMRTGVIQRISSSNIDPESAINVLDLVFSLGSWHKEEIEPGDKSQRAMLATKVRPLKLKLVELMYEASKTLSRVEMYDFIGSARTLWRHCNNVYEDLEM